MGAGRFSVLAAVVLLGVCSCASTDSGAGSDLQMSDLDGMAYVGGDVSDDGVPRDLVAGSELLMQFSGDNVSTSAGCNQMGGGFTITEGRLTPVDGLASTEMACAPALMDQEAWWSSFLLAEPAVALQGDQLVLTGGTTVVTLTDREVVDPAPPLVGTAWRLDALIDGDAVSSVPVGVTASLEFTADGRVAVQAGCNRGNASVAVTDTTMAFGPMALTRMACEGAAADVEATVLAVLDGTVPFTQERGSLTLQKDGTGLVYTAR